MSDSQKSSKQIDEARQELSATKEKLRDETSAKERLTREKARLETEIKLASQAARAAAHAHAAEAIERERLRRVAEAPDEIRWALRRPRQEAVARSRQDVGYREA